MSDPNEYPTYDYPSQPSNNQFPYEPAGVHRDDNWFDPNGVYRQEYDRTDIFTPPPQPAVWEER